MSTNDAQAVIDVALSASKPEALQAGEIVSFVVPAGAEQQTLDLEMYLPVPRRKQGVANLHTADALIRYVGKHAEEGATDIYANADSYEISAVLNGASEAEPGWGDHRAVLRLKKTEQWRRWMERHRLIGAQSEFADFIEDNLEDIAEPPGADLLELAQSFEATTSAQFKSAKRLSSGEVQLLYTETIDAKAGQNGTMTIPQEFTVVLAPFEGVDANPLTARLRYRVAGNTLRIGYILDRPDKVEREAFDAAVGHIETATGFVVLRGTPPA